MRTRRPNWDQEVPNSLNLPTATAELRVCFSGFLIDESSFDAGLKDSLMHLFGAALQVGHTQTRILSAVCSAQVDLLLDGTSKAWTGLPGQTWGNYGSS